MKKSSYFDFVLYHRHSVDSLMSVIRFLCQDNNFDRYHRHPMSRSYSSDALIQSEFEHRHASRVAFDWPIIEACASTYFMFEQSRHYPLVELKQALVVSVLPSPLTLLCQMVCHVDPQSLGDQAATWEQSHLVFYHSFTP